MISQFTIGTSRTINLGNYESIRVEASVTINVDDGDWPEVKRAAQIELRQLLEETLKAQNPKTQDKLL